MTVCGCAVTVLLGVALVFATPDSTPSHVSTSALQRGAGRLGRSVGAFGMFDKMAAKERRRPGKYRNPDYDGGYGKPEYPHPGYRPSGGYPHYGSGAASSASASASAGSVASGPGAGALSQSHALSQSATLGMGPYGASISNSQASANSAAGAGYYRRPYPRPRPSHYEAPDRYEEY